MMQAATTQPEGFLVLQKNQTLRDGASYPSNTNKKNTTTTSGQWLYFIDTNYSSTPRIQPGGVGSNTDRNPFAKENTTARQKKQNTTIDSTCDNNNENHENYTDETRKAGTFITDLPEIDETQNDKQHTITVRT